MKNLNDYNSTVFSTVASPSPPSWDTFVTISLISATSSVILALVTATGNGLLLLAIWKDPLHCFRTPVTLIVLSLAVADFITGVIIDPLHAFLGFVHFLGMEGALKDVIKTVVFINVHLAFITMNTSFLTLLALTWSQFLAISYPHRHRAVVTKRKVVCVIVAIWLYTLIFSLLHNMGVPAVVVANLDTYLNTTCVLIALTWAYIFLYIAYTRHFRRMVPIRIGRHSIDALGYKRHHERRKFVVVNFMLVVFVVVFSLPVLILSHVNVYSQNTLPPEEHRIAKLLATDALLIKFALDPYIYAWRLPKFRLAFKRLVKCS